MKKQLFYIFNILFLFTIIISFTSCIDFDGILSVFAKTDAMSDSNNEIIVLARGDEGLTIENGYQKIRQGSNVTFSFRVKEGYSYISNTKDARCSFDATNNTYALTFDEVYSSFTVDIVTMSKEDFYNVEIKYNAEMGDVVTQGELSSPFASEITLISTPKEGCEFLGYSLYNFIELQGDLLLQDSTYTFIPDAKNTVIYANFKPIELPPPPEPYRIEVYKNATLCDYKFLYGSREMLEAEEVCIEATFDENYQFLGYSSGGFLTDGGALLSESPTYVFTPESKITQIYMNFERVVIVRHTIEIISNHPDAVFTYLKGAPALEWSADVEIEANVPDGYVFSGFSKDAFIVNGGEPLNKDRNYCFYAVEDETVLYANYTKKEEYHIVYHANGGKILNSENDYFTFTNPYNSHFMLQYTFHDGSDIVSFEREGYVLVGYSTKPVDDYRTYGGANYIPGFSNLGGICEVDRDTGVLLLYCVWAKESDESLFTYEKYTYTNMYQQGNKSKTFSISGYRILSYLGKEKTIVVPEQIDGVNVVGIAPNVIASEDAQIGRIVLPKTICCVEENAFRGATGLVELVFFNSVQTIQNSSFAPSLMTLVINSQRKPAMNGAEGSFILKYERIRYLKSIDAQMLVVLSGSSSLNGLNSRLLEELLFGEYAVVNYGTNAGANMLFYLRALSRIASEGDIVILAPEYTMNQTFGNNSLGYKTFRGNDQGYDIFREVDISEFTDVFKGWTEYQNEMMPKSVGEYQDSKSCTMNIYGDLLGSRNKNAFTQGKASSLAKSYLSATNAARLNDVNHTFVENGATLLLSFAPADIKLFSESTRGNADLFAKDCANKLDFPVISNPATYFLDEEYIYNSAWHPTYKGANIRTVELAFDILTYFDSYEDDSYMNIAQRNLFNSTEYPDNF